MHDRRSFLELAAAAGAGLESREIRPRCRMPKTRTWLCALAAAAAIGSSALPVRAQDDVTHERLDRLEGDLQRAEDVAAIKRLQRAYGYYLDKGLWTDLGELFTDDAVANYPAGVYIGKPSIQRHLHLNVGAVEMGQNGLGDGRLYNHMNLQPVVHLDAGGNTAKGRWRAFAMFGRYGGGATWAEGVYEMTYRKENGAWKIASLDYHSGFAASYDTGWVPPPGPRQARGPRNLPHPADRERNMPCEGFPDACLAPFHYANPGTRAGGLLWPDDGAPTRLDPQRGAVRDRATALARRAARLADEHEIENLQKIYGYYLDRALWQQVADLFADGGTIEFGQQGVYEGKARIREFLSLMGPEGLRDGWLNDHLQLQILVSVAPDGLTAKSRSRELGMTGVYERYGQWSEGLYENTYVKEDGVWKIASMRFFPTFITDYAQGWGRDAQPAPEASTELPPDRGPTEVYEIYPKAHVPAFHYDNPVTGAAPTYPRGAGRPSRDAIRLARARVTPSATPGVRPLDAQETGTLVADAERQVARAKDYHELENLEGAYGYYLDKNLWNDLADLFAEGGSMELAQRGVYEGRERVRGFLLAVFGRGGEGPVAGRLGNHVQMQPVIHVAPDGQSANIRVRMMQQLTFGERASMGGSIYENVAVKEDGVWKFETLHTFNTWTAGYDGGWARNPGRGVPGPSESFPPDAPPTLEFTMFPNVYEIPFHYRHPVTGRTVSGLIRKPYAEGAGEPPAIAADLDGSAAPRPDTFDYETWDAYLGGGDSSQYSSLDRIDRGNVSRLEVAWTYSTGERGVYRFNPIVVDGVMYVLAHDNSLVALDAASGRELWRHPHEGRVGNRGINYWASEDGTDRRLLYLNDGYLTALDADSGATIESFGSAGRVDLRVGLDSGAGDVRQLQTDNPGRIFENLIIMSLPAGSAGYASTPADIHAYDVVTGELVWIFHTVPHAGEFGADTWPEDAGAAYGGVHNWSESTVDANLGIVYIPTGTARYDFYGGNRHGANLFGNSLLALDARTGKRLWHFQTIHHDLWDLDLPTAPKLLNVVHEGQTVAAVAQPSKQGLLFVFDRITGEPLWPIEERRVPQSNAPGEQSWPTQPFPTQLPPFARTRFTVDDINPFISEQERAAIREQLMTYRNEGLYTPPSLQGTIMMPGHNGGANWGSSAVDPINGKIYIVSKELPTTATLRVPDRVPEGVVIPGATDDFVAYNVPIDFMLQSNGLSAIGPPWSQITAYDLNAGVIEWQIPNGEVMTLAARGITNTGSHAPRGGPVVTAGGLIFVATSSDRKFRARDVRDGAVLWEYELPAASEGVPAVYAVDGRQYVAIPVGGNGLFSQNLGLPEPGAGQYMVFAVPE